MNNPEPQDLALPEDSDPTGAPEEFGFPAKATLQQRQCWLNQERFLEAFKECCRISEAAKAIGLTYWAVRQWVDADKYSFNKRFAAAELVYVEKLEAEIDRRALEGIDHPVVYQGKITAHFKEYSDNLLMFRTKKLRPDYRDNVVKDVPETPITTQIVINLPPGFKLPPGQELGRNMRMPEPDPEPEVIDVEGRPVPDEAKEETP